MIGRWKFWLITALVTVLVAAAIYVPILRKRMRRAARQQQQTEEQARRELVQPVPLNPGDPRVKTKFFWLSDSDESALAPVIVELPLSSDPVLRSKQVLNTLLAGPVEAEQRTLPPETVLLAFYILPDGTAVADFSEALATSLPSGIASEQLAVDSISRTLEANVPQAQRLKILIHGQEMETLAGHVDLTGTFLVNTKLGQPPPSSAPTTPTTLAAPAALTPDASPGKLGQPATKP